MGFRIRFGREYLALVLRNYNKDPNMKSLESRGLLIRGLHTPI